MDSNYILLGLNEDATLEEAKAAYAYWKKKYQAADFDDEPEYAKRKIKALGQAYNNVCMSIAGYVPEEKAEPSGSKKVVPQKIKRLGEKVNLNTDSITDFADNLKNSAMRFLDQIDKEHGFAPGFSEDDQDSEYDEIEED